MPSFSLEKAKREPSAVSHWSKRIYREDRDRQFPEGKRKDEKQQAQAVTKEIMVGVKKKFVMVSMVKPLNRLPRETGISASSD